MAIKLPFKLDVKSITLIISLIFNLLGGTGTVQPLVGGVECPSVEAPLPAAAPASVTPAPTPALLPSN